MAWEELTDEERTALKRMNRGPHLALSEDMADRLLSLGLAERRPAGFGINRAGRELVVNALLSARRT